MARLYLLFASVYLLEGITEIPFILNVYLKKLSFSPSQIGTILFLGSLWFIFLKPLIGFIADFWRKFNKRLVLTIGLLCSSMGWLVIADAQSTVAMTVGVSLKVIAIALLDVLIDGMIVTVSTAKNRTFIQSLVYGCRFGGAMLFSSWAGGKIDEGVMAFTQIYYLFSVTSLLVLIPVLIYRQEEVKRIPEKEDKTQGKTLSIEEQVPFREKIGQLAHPSFGWLLILLFLYSFGADTTTFFEPLVQERFGGEFLGRIVSIYYVGIVIGILTIPVLRSMLSMKTLFVVSLVGWCLAEISCLGIARWNGGMIYFFGGVFNAFSSIALLTVAVSMCKKKGIETFAFAFAISVKNLMDNSNVLIGGYVMEAVGITWLFVISSLCGLLPFLVLHKIDFKEI